MNWPHIIYYREDDVKRRKVAILPWHYSPTHALRKLNIVKELIVMNIGGEGFNGKKVVKNFISALSYL